MGKETVVLLSFFEYSSGEEPRPIRIEMNPPLTLPAQRARGSSPCGGADFRQNSFVSALILYHIHISHTRKRKPAGTRTFLQDPAGSLSDAATQGRRCVIGYDKRHLPLQRGGIPYPTNISGAFSQKQTLL